MKWFVISFEHPWKNTAITSIHKAHCRIQQEGKVKTDKRLPQNEINYFSTANSDVIERELLVSQRKRSIGREITN